MGLHREIRELVNEILEYYRRLSETPTFHPLRNIRETLLTNTCTELKQWMVDHKQDELRHKGYKFIRDINGNLSIQQTGINEPILG